jgi:tetratricopeptide (TPR) repeat protein
LPNKVLITSRRRDFKADYPVKVSGMRRDQFDELTRTTATKLGIISLLGLAYLDNLFEQSNGHPYVVKVVLGEVSRSKRTGSVERIVSRHENILDALFERTFSTISPTAQRVFLTLCNWRSMVPRLAVEATLLRPDNEHMDVEEAIDVLERSSLIELFRGEGSDDEFIRVPLATQIFGSRKLIASPMRPAVDVDTEFIRSFGAMQPADVNRGLSPRIERLISALSERVVAGDSIESHVAILEHVASKYPTAWLNIARLHIESPDPETQRRALTSIERYLEVNPDDSEAWRQYAQHARNLGDFSREINAMFRLAERPGAPYGDISNAANLLNRFLNERVLSFDVDERRAMLERVIGLMRSRIAEADANDHSRLAWLYLNLGNLDEARNLAAKGLVLDPTNPHCLRLMQKH